MSFVTIQPENSDLQRLKDQGQILMMTNQVEKALQLYAEILKEHPEDIDSLLFVGDSCLLEGNADGALQLYQHAFEQQPFRKDVERRVLMARHAAHVPVAEETQIGVTDEEDMKVLLQRMAGRSIPVTEEEIFETRRLMDEFLRSPSPAQFVSDHLEKVDSLLLAMIELNIRRARQEGQLDQVDVLQNLLELAASQIKTRNGRVSLALEETRGHRTRVQPVRVLVIGVNTLDAPFRQQLLAGALAGCGYEVVTESKKAIDWKSFDILIGHNPHADRELMNGLVIRASARMPTLVDMDYDFRKLPPEHPEYRRLGPGNLENMRFFTAAMQMANIITVSSAATAAVLQDAGYRVQWIPEGWNQHNPLWQKVLPERLSVNLGLFTIPGQVEDVAQIRRAVVRVLREFPNTRLAISGDPAVYQLFENVSEVRRLYLPPVEPEDHPFQLAQVDVLLVPLQETPFNQQKSDRQVMEAGARRIPWVASPSWSAVEWSKGGMLAYSAEDWYSHLRTLVSDEHLRNSLGQAGYQKALQREMKVLGNIWSTAIQQAMAFKVNP